MTLEIALSMVRDAGYRVSKPKPKLDPLSYAASCERRGLNAVGKPYGTQFNPNYRMKYKPRKYAPGGGDVGKGISPETWTAMCQAAAAEWIVKMGAAS